MRPSIFHLPSSPAGVTSDMTSDPRRPTAGTLHRTGPSALSLITHQEAPLASVSLPPVGKKEVERYQKVHSVRRILQRCGVVVSVSGPARAREGGGPGREVFALGWIRRF